MLQVVKMGNKIYRYTALIVRLAITEADLREYILKLQLRYGKKTASKAILEKLRECMKREGAREKRTERRKQNSKQSLHN